MKPRVYWTYYPSSCRGFWRVSHMPKPRPTNAKLWYQAHAITLRFNGENDIIFFRKTRYEMAYAEQLELRKTT